MELASLRPIRWITLGAAGLMVAAAFGWWLRRTPDAVAVPAERAVSTNLVVEVRNASSRPGMARLVTGLLREKGVDVIYFGTSATMLDSTTVLVRRGALARGHEIARLLGRAVVKLAPDTLLRVDATILIGADYRLPKDRFPL